MPLNFRSLDLNLLRVFDEVMSERSLTRAAHKLNITQPAVSNAMRRLREVLGDELLVRQGQGVEPTPRAQVLWPVVREAMQQLEGVLAPDDFNPATADTTFVIAMADATAATLTEPRRTPRSSSSSVLRRCSSCSTVITWRENTSPAAVSRRPELRRSNSGLPISSSSCSSWRLTADDATCRWRAASRMEPQRRIMSK